MQPKQYEISIYTLKTSIKNIDLRKFPGLDLITGYCFKKLLFHIESFAKLFQNMFNGSTTLPDWLSHANTTLLSKNKQTNATTKYGPIACLDI